MNLVRIYQALSDETRLRLVNLLTQRSLCVCHLQEVLARPQTQISQHLARLKKDGLVESHRHQNWMIYSLPAKISSSLEAHVKCLQVCVPTEATLKSDLQALHKLKGTCDWIDDVGNTIQPPALSSRQKSKGGNRN